MPHYSAGGARVEIRDAAGTDVTNRIRRRTYASGVPPGRYLVRVRGSLGRPVEREVDVPAGTDVVTSISIEGGSAIRLLVRRDSGQLEKSVDFRVVGASGEPVTVEYTDATLSTEPEFRHEGRTLRGVPAHGVIRLGPGEWTVQRLSGDEVVGSWPVRAWPEVITQLDTRARGAARGMRPAKPVRLR